MGRHDFSVHCRHVDSETKSQDCIISGRLPSWLRGDFITIGYGITKVGNSEYEHLFDSSAILHKFAIESCKVQYSSRFLQSETYKTNKKAGKIVHAEFATPGSSNNKNLLSRIVHVMDSHSAHSDNCTHILNVGSRYYCNGNSPCSHEINPKTLDVANRIDLYKICKINSKSPGIMQDKKGYYYSLCLTVTILGPKYALVKYPKDGNLEEGKIVATFSCQMRLSPSFVHSAAMTENYLIFAETPLCVSLLDVISDLNSCAPAVNHLRWQEDKKSLIRVIELETWKESETNYVADPFFYFNIVNAYEERGHLVMVLSTFKDFSCVKNFYIKSLREEAKKEKNDYANYVESIFPDLSRYVLPLDHSLADNNQKNLVTLSNTSCKAVKVGSEIHLAGEVLGEFAYSSSATRNFQRTSNGKNSFLFNHSASRSSDNNYLTVVKYNVDTKETVSFYEEDLYPSKPTFLADPDGQDEDDGILLSQCVRSSDPCYVGLLILSAKTMTEICRIHTKIKSKAAMSLQAVFAPESNS